MPLVVACPSCRASVPASHKFCRDCGAALTPGDPGGAAGAPGKAPGPAAAGRRFVTVLFADISGFTAMSEKLDPEEVTTLINAFFQILTEPIYRYGGVVDKYIGDAIMAVFGAPVAHEDDPVRAVRAAWDMQDRAIRFATDLERQIGIPLRIRVGLNSGLAVYSAVGGKERADFTVMGDTVNLAQRMEANAGLGKVLVTAETYRRTRQAFAFDVREPIKVKGKAAPVEVFELRGPLPGTALLQERPFVGRAAEVRMLSDALERARLGKPQAMWVSAEAGVGKSALIGHFLRLHGSPPALRYRVRCNSFDVDTSYAMVRGVLLACLGLSWHAPAEEVATHLHKFMGSREGGDSRATALLAHLLGVAVADSGVSSLSPQQLRTGAFVTLNDLILDRCAREPLILMLLDLQWADAASLEWLESFWNRMAAGECQVRLLAICESRLDRRIPVPAPESGVELGTVRPLPLSESEARELAALVLKADSHALEPGARRVIDTILERAEGNPFYIGELLRAASDGGALVRSGETWRAGAGVQALPASIHGAVAALLDRLPEDQRRVVEMAAVMGRRFERQALLAAAGEEAVRAIEPLVACKIFYRREAELGFTQAALQEVAYEGTLLARRKQLHRQVGLALEALAGQDAARAAPRLAQHFLRAEDFGPAARYLVQAGDLARSACSNVQARDCYRSALLHLDSRIEGAEPSRAEVLLRLAAVELALSRLDEASAALDELDRMGEATVHSLSLRADILRTRGDLPGALARYRSAVGAAGAGQTRAAAVALIGQGNVERRLGHYQEAMSLARQARAALESLDCHAEAAEAYGLVGICRQRLGEVDLALQEHEEALRLREQAGDLAGIGRSLNNLAILATAQGRWPEAYQHYTRSLALARRMGDIRAIAIVLGNLGELLLGSGDDAGAERHVREALRLAQQLGDSVSELICGGSLAQVFLQREAGPQALEAVDRCLALASQTGHGEYAADLRCFRGRALRLTGDLAGAAAELREARELAVAAGNATVVGVIDRELAELAEAAGDREQAWALARQAAERLGSAGSPLEHGRALALLARIAPADQRGEWRQAAIVLFERLGARRDLALLEDPVVDRS